MSFDQQKCPKCKTLKPFLLRTQRGRVLTCLDCKAKADSKGRITIGDREVKRNYGTHRGLSSNLGATILPHLELPQPETKEPLESKDQEDQEEL